MIAESVLIKMGVWLGEKLINKGFESYYKKLTDTDELTEKFNTAINETSILLQKKYPNILGGSIEYFFNNEVVFNELFKLLFKSSTINKEIIENSFDITTLPQNFIEEFINTLRVELYKDKDFDDILSNKEIFVLIHGIETNVSKIAKLSNLSKNELFKIREILQERIGELFVLSEFKSQYSKNALHNLSQIKFLGLGVELTIEKKRKKIEDIFVKPTLKLKNKQFRSKKTQELFGANKNIIDEIDYDSIFDSHDKLVIVGAPGSGKSVLLKSIICNILSENTKHFNNKNIFNYIPFRIELRKYLAFKKSNNGNILKYLSVLLENEYGILNITKHILEKLFLDNKCAIFFDGLDEIFKIKDKIEIKNDIENFLNYYKNTTSIVTSRIIGYHEAQFDSDEFCELQILNFSTDQIVDYVKKWYSKEELDEKHREEGVAGFLSAMDDIDDELLTNPLLLSLIVLIFKNNLRIPQSKLDIYQSCTKTLVDKWDKNKDLIVELNDDIYEQKEKIFAELAYWQYKQLSSNKIKLTYDLAKKQVAESIVDKIDTTKEGDEYELAESFLTYAQKRSIYFDNNFTHKTFLEYFTAYWIYSNIEKKHLTKKRDELISKYISNSFWFIVFELLLNFIDKDQADDDIINELVQYQIKKSTKSFPFLINTISTVNNISDKQISILYSESIKLLVNSLITKDSGSKKISNSELIEKVAHGIRTVVKNNDKQGKILIELLPTLEKSRLNLKDLYTLYLELRIFGQFEDHDFELIIENYEKYSESVENSDYLFLLSKFTNYNLYSRNYLELFLEYLTNFGIRSVYKDHRGVFYNLGFSSVMVRYIITQFNKNNIKNYSTNFNKILNTKLSTNSIVNYFIKKNIYVPFNSDFRKNIFYSTRNEKNPDYLKILLSICSTFGNETWFDSFKMEELTKTRIFTSQKKTIIIKLIKSNTQSSKRELIDEYVSLN